MYILYNHIARQFQWSFRVRGRVAIPWLETLAHALGWMCHGELVMLPFTFKSLFPLCGAQGRSTSCRYVDLLQGLVENECCGEHKIGSLVKTIQYAMTLK